MQIPDLVSALKPIQGCLGVETARTDSGKEVIFAWFADKDAVLRWYHSNVHRGLQDGFFPDLKRREPLDGLPDDVGPILAIASLTPGERSVFQETAMPISQISIELYTPLTGGLFLGGRFAPDSLKVSGMRDYTPRARSKR